jgi:aryl-alcohol dehydrogenase-like predicted oxidoreductase
MVEMNGRELGRTGIIIPPLGMGCWAIGGPFWHGTTPLGWGEVDDGESARAVQSAFELGIRLFDTADVYGTGRSERVLGRALSGHRDEVIIASKWGNTYEESSRQLLTPDITPGYLRRALEATLRRLATDYLDIYQFHLADIEPADTMPLVEELEALVAAGKIRAYGWSTDDPRRAGSWAAGEHCSVVQHELNVLRDAPEMLALVERLGWTSLNRGPLAMGLISDKYATDTLLPDNDVRGKPAPDWMRYFENGRPSSRWLARRDAIRDILASDGRTPVQGALAWIWARSPATVPLPGFRTVDHVRENVGALSRGPLSDSAMTEIARLLSYDLAGK